MRNFFKTSVKTKVTLRQVKLTMTKASLINQTAQLKSLRSHPRSWALKTKWFNRSNSRHKSKWCKELDWLMANLPQSPSKLVITVPYSLEAVTKIHSRGPICTRWTTCHPYCKERALRKISTCLVMYSQVSKSGVSQLNRQRVQCEAPRSLSMNSSQVVQIARNFTFYKSVHCKKFAKWPTRWKVWIVWVKEAPFKSWKKIGSGKRSSTRCQLRRRKQLKICNVNLIVSKLKRWS